MLGNEATAEEFLAHLVGAFGEVWRVLRDDGSCWVNIGDTRDGLNAAMIPARFALAMQADGWILRDCITWAKPSSMPESVRGWLWEPCRVKVAGGRVPRHGVDRGAGHVDESDVSNREDGATWSPCPGCAKCAPNGGLVLRRGNWRTTNASEMIYLFVKRPGAYLDGEAVKLVAKSGMMRGTFRGSVGGYVNNHARISSDAAPISQVGSVQSSAEVNLRNVWSDITPEAHAFGHYATFPMDLPTRCILAGTSEEGVCASCGAPWARVVERDTTLAESRRGTTSYARRGLEAGNRFASATPGVTTETRTLSWRATCGCPDAPPVPATVLDPFGGTMTTCIAAMRLGRRSVGLDLSQGYLEIAQRRLAAETLPLGGV